MLDWEKPSYTSDVLWSHNKGAGCLHFVDICKNSHLCHYGVRSLDDSLGTEDQLEASRACSNPVKSIGQ